MDNIRLVYAANSSDDAGGFAGVIVEPEVTRAQIETIGNTLARLNIVRSVSPCWSPGSQELELRVQLLNSRYATWHDRCFSDLMHELVEAVQPRFTREAVLSNRTIGETSITVLTPRERRSDRGSGQTLPFSFNHFTHEDEVAVNDVLDDCYVVVEGNRLILHAPTQDSSDTLEKISSILRVELIWGDNSSE